MKKGIKILSVLAVMAMFASCTKSYVCDCTVTYGDGTTEETSSESFEASKKSDAEDACSETEGSLEAGYQLSDPEAKVSCETNKS